MMRANRLNMIIGTACCALMMACSQQAQETKSEKMTVGNPYLPLWEHIPDGEPYVFDDPDNPGKQRVYIYGSHDDLKTDYCGRDQVVWSAPVEDLSQWRYDGEILVVDKNAKGEPFDSAKTADVLFAPDVTMMTDSTGKKTYYLFPNDQTGYRNGLIAKSDRPDGPFEVCNWNADDPNKVDGIYGFDPAVFVDDDGRVYGYWGFGHSMAAEIDPTTMCTVKPGTKVVDGMIPGFQEEPGNKFRFFEASSIRKIKDKYIFIYSRFTEDGEFGLSTSNYTLAYCYSDQPLGPWTYGGTIIDGRGREINEQGDTIASATPDGNTHGSICEVNGQWYVFYHRQTGTNEFARQAMVAPIEVKIEEGGKVEISEGEYNSEGFALDGLNPLERHSAGIACWLTGPKPAIHEWPNNTYFGSYIEASYGTDDKFDAPYDLKNNSNRIVNNTAGSIVGYKYFNFANTNEEEDIQLRLRLIPEGVDGTIQVMADRPWVSQGGILLGSYDLKADMPKTSTEITIDVPTLSEMTGKHAIYFLFLSDTKDKSLCTLEDFVFTF